VALTGGRTPGRAYELAAGIEADWTRVELWWGDERCVPPDDARSNYRLAKEALLDRVDAGAIHRIQGELGREEGARLYEEELEAVEGFELVLLGLGPDGHVASLFPDRPTLDVADRRAIGAEAGLEPFVDRITLTLPTLRATRALLFLVTGGDKADAVRRAFAGEPSRSTPGSLVRAELGSTTAVLDAAAAALLPGGSG
jgi:6-phosphogluconolactonase